MSKQNFKTKIVNSMFWVSQKPVLFRDLLEANANFNEGMLVDPSKLNFRFLYGKSYITFGIFALVVLVPFIVLTHNIFTKIDFHFSIVGAVVITSLVFVGFDVFKAWARKELTRRLIKEAWAVHFPYFPYEKYSKKVEIIYNEALKFDIPKAKLEQYVLDKIVENEG
ncbi:MAG: hypothetical protein MR902_03270 [Campylobacter sp.]|nr:hypothetical protein [Campylobacter sp.]